MYCQPNKNINYLNCIMGKIIKRHGVSNKKLSINKRVNEHLIKNVQFLMHSTYSWRFSKLRFVRRIRRSLNDKIRFKNYTQHSFITLEKHKHPDAIRIEFRSLSEIPLDFF